MNLIKALRIIWSCRKLRMNVKHGMEPGYWRAHVAISYDSYNQACNYILKYSLTTLLIKLGIL